MGLCMCAYMYVYELDALAKQLILRLQTPFLISRLHPYLMSLQSTTTTNNNPGPLRHSAVDQGHGEYRRLSPLRQHIATMTRRM